ncbi:hypothetical protein IFM89_004647 [Coptis chinensis]|uniref:Uncharacterized protein n=1 Tax=Coptis chinensis TaxID=261450 RepID=A0A835I987_9MAGN|nr:hypothetical protein IFM89_004647 [Coptis chinensis]
MNSLKSSYGIEIKRRESLERSCNELKQDNDRLVKLYSDSLNKLANQIERRSNCQSLKDELKKVNEEQISKEEVRFTFIICGLYFADSLPMEHKKAVDLLQQEHAATIGDLEARVRNFLHQEEANLEMINQLHKDLAAHKTQIETLSRRLERVHADAESKYNHEVQDLRDWLLVEQEEKRELNVKLQYAEKELANSRKKLEEQQRDSTANRHVETLKQKLMKLRKENEALKRQLNNNKHRY